MKNLKFEILVDGKPEVAYVRPENKNKFLEKYQNSFPKEVINAEQLDIEIKPNNKIDSLGKPQGTDLSQPITTTIDTELPSVDTSLESPQRFNIEDTVKSITQPGYKPEPGSSFTYGQQTTDGEPPLIETDDDTEDKNLDLRVVEEQETKFNNLFSKYNPEIDGKRKYSQQDFFVKFLEPKFVSALADHTKLSFKTGNVTTLNGMFEKDWVNANIEKYGGKDQSLKAWKELVFLTEIYNQTAELNRDLKSSQGMTQYNVKGYFDYEKENIKNPIGGDQGLLLDVDLIDKKDIVSVPKVGGELFTWQLHTKKKSEIMLKDFEIYVGNSLVKEKSDLEVKFEKENKDFFKQNKRLKELKINTLKKVEEKFKLETESFNSIVEKELAPFRDDLLKEWNEKYPKGACDPDEMGFNLHDDNCWNPEDLDRFNKKLQGKELEIKNKLPGYKDLLKEKTIYQNDLFEENASYRRFKSKQTKEYNNFIEKQFEKFKIGYVRKLNYWDKSDLNGILNSVLKDSKEFSWEPEQKKEAFKQHLDKYLSKDGVVIDNDDRDEYQLEFWMHMYDALQETTQDKETVLETKALNRFGKITYNKEIKVTEETTLSQFYFETLADEFISMADSSMDRNKDAIIVNKDTINVYSQSKEEATLNVGVTPSIFVKSKQKDIKSLPTSIVSGIKIKDGATYDKNTKTINGNREIAWDGKRWSFKQTHTYEIKEYTEDLTRIKELLYDQMEERGFTKEQIQVLEEGGKITLKANQVKFRFDQPKLKRAKNVVISKESIDSQVARIFQEQNLKLLQQVRKYGFDVKNNPENIEDVGFFNGLTSLRLHEYIPIVSGLVDMNDKKTIKQITDKIREGGKESLSTSERLLIMMHGIKNQSNAWVEKNALTSYKAGRSTAHSIPFLGEFIIGSPIFTATKKLAATGLLSTIIKRNSGKMLLGSTQAAKITSATGKYSGMQKFRIEYVNKFGRKAIINNKPIDYISTIVGLNAQTLFTGAPRIAASTFENLTEDVLFMVSSEGNDIFTAFDEVGRKMGLKPIEESIRSALLKGYGMQFSEVFTERIIGAQAFKWGSRAKKRIFGPGTVLGRLTNDSDFLNKITFAHLTRKLKLTNLYNRPSEMAKQFFRMSSYNSVFGEIFEEFFNIPLQNWIQGEGPILQGILKYDENGRRIGWDTDTMGSISISSLFMSGTMALGGAALSGPTNMHAPGYIVNYRRFNEEYQAMAYLEQLKKQGRLHNDIDIEITNDFSATTNFRKYLKKEGLDPNTVKDKSFKRIESAKIAAEIEILNNTESVETRQEIENINNELKELTNAPAQSRDMNSINALQLKKEKLLNNTKNFLKKDKNSIFSTNRKFYKKTTKQVQKIIKQISKFSDLEIVETSNSIGAEGAYLSELGLERRNDGRIYYKPGVKKGSFDEQSQRIISGDNFISIENFIEEARTAHGFHVNNRITGKQKLILNEDLAVTQSGSNVAAHELFHFYLNQMLGNNVEMRLALGQSFMKYVSSINPNAVRDSGFRERLMSYRGKPLAEQSEEAMTIFLDAISTGALQFNEGTFTKLGDIFRHIGGKSGADIKFKNGRDVYNFIKEFKQSIKRGKLSDNLMQAFDNKFKFDVGGEIQKLIEGNEKQTKTQQTGDDVSSLFSKPIIEAAKKRSRKEIRQENKEIYDEIVELHEVLQQENPNITLKEVFNLPENKNLKQELIENNLGLAIERATVAGRVGKGLNLDEKKKIGFNEFLSGYLTELTALADTWNPAENNSFGTYAGGLLRKRYGQILDKAKSSLDREGGPGTVSTDQQIDGETIEKQIADQTDRRIENFESQPVLEQQLSIKNNRVKLAPRLKFVRNEIDFNEKTNNSISKVVDKTNYQTKGKYYEDVLEDIAGQVNEKASTPAGVTPTGKAFGVLDAIAKNEFKVDAKAILAKPYNLPIKDSKNIRERIAFLAETDNYFYKDRGKLQRVRARNAEEALVIAKHNTGNLKMKLSDLQRDEVGGIKGILKAAYTPLQYNQRTKKSTKINKASITALYQDMNLRVPNIKGKALNVDNMTEADLLALHGINPDFTLMPHNRKYDGLLKGFIKQSSVFAFNQAVRETQGQEVSDIAEGRPGSAVISGQVDVFFSKKDSEIAKKYKQSNTYYEINSIDNVKRYINVDIPKIINVFKDYPGLLTANELVNGLNAIKNPEFKYELRKGAQSYTELKVRGKFPKRDFAKFVGNTASQMNPVKIAEFNRQAEINFDAHWTAIDKALQKDPSLLGPILIYLSNAISSKTHIHRSGAKFTYYDNTTNEKLYLEHALQNVNAYRTLIEASMNDKTKSRKNFKAAFKQLKNNYNLMAVRKVDNTKLDKAKYPDANGNLVSFKDNMGLNWNIFDNIWTERYFNEFVAKMFGGGSYGINPNNLTNPQTGKTLAEDFNINVDGSFRFSKPAIEIKSKQNLNDAFDNKIKFSKTGQTRGMSTFDFDDTLGFTKSGVRVTMPNLDGKPKPKRKVVFLAGGAGSGKGSIITKLGLEKQGFKIVNSDISLEWLKKNSGLPADMRDLTKPQRSTLGKLGAESRKIARRKMMKYQGEGNGVIVDGTGGSAKQMQKLVDEFKDKGYDVSMMFVETSLDIALERNRNRKERSLLSIIVKRNHEAVQKNKSGFKTLFGERFMEVNTDNMTLEAPVPDNVVEQMNDFVSSYEKRRIDAAEFAEQGDAILEQGGKFDFTEFNNVVDGTPGPLLNKAKERAAKFGTKDMFVLTARPQGSAKAIHEFLKSQGLDIPIGNITGLANSTANAKAEWFVQKFAEGYNDMYFVDDALQNVEAVRDVLNQLDVKSDVVQAEIKFSKAMNDGINEMIERKKGVDASKIFSQAEAKKLGKNIGKFSIYIPPSAEDFKGLLYYFLGKGEQGNKDMKFMEESLLKPFAKGIRAWNTYKQNMSDDYLNLKKAMPEVSKSINNKVPGTNFTNDTAVRVYLWDKNGFDIPGISESLKATLVNHVKNNKDLMTFADTLSTITKRKDGYVAAGQNWSVGSIGRDLIKVVNKVGRQEFLSEWIENKDVIFSTDNLNKIEAIYGTRFIEALNNILYRMENGGNRKMSKDRDVNFMVNWINGAVGSIMFFNTRSALLQTLSAVNFVNFSDNNVFNATKAFANQPQFWKDFAMLFNSDQLKQRRRGLQTDVSASELTKSFKENGNSYEAVVNFLLEKGFLPTQIADSTAIAFGGASFYRNRYNKYIKEGMSAKQANDQAMLDFQEIAEETQQSSREDLVSKQQASILGRLVLAFQNVTMQYGRLTKKALSDLVNRRGDTKTNISKIIYYGAVQNIVFASLQSALAFLMFGGSDDEELIEDRTRRTINGALDSFLRGLGIYGALGSALKNTALAWQKESELSQEGKGFGRDAKWNIAREALSLSPPIGSKVRKVVNAYSTKEFGRDISDKLKFRLENPKLQAATGIIEGITNIPLNRMLNKANNLEEAITGQHETWQRVALIAGWNKWDIGIKDEEVEAAKEEVKIEKKEKKEVEKKEKKIIKEKIKEEEKKKEEKRKKDEGIKTLRCSGTRSNGERCNMRGETKSKKFLCVYHKPFKDGDDLDGDGKKEYRCTATKSNGKRCKNKTENENKKCYAHQ